jgi:signal transduction histidine kinase
LEWEPRFDAIKWVQVDLGRSLPLDEVRLIPSRPRDWSLVTGFGFPLRFRVEACDEPNFDVPLVLRSEEANDFRNPGENAVTVPCGGVTARFVRVTATKLWLRRNDYVFALAELQVFAGGTNAALGAKVQALDSVEHGYWSKRALVDGFSSQKRLAPLGAWLRGLARRGELETRLKQLDGEFARQIHDTLAKLGRWSIGAMVVVVTGIALLVYRYRLVRMLELERLRTSIATDLHDELGTRLTRIGLLSELVERQTAGAHPAKSEIAQISAMTHDMVRTMDEIVWAVNPRNDTLEDLANYILHFAQEFFRHASVRCRLDIPASLPPLRLTTALRHNVFLAVKEALNNVVRHAQASNVRVTLRLEGTVLSIVVQDDGRGFNEESQRPSGNGLRNMQQRLESIGGRVEVESGSGIGTTVRFHAKLRDNKR